MEREELLSILKERGAILEGHFRLSSGLHSSTYLQMARLLEDPSIGRKIGALLGEKLARYEVDLVVGPALGGIVISYMVGMALDRMSIFTERGTSNDMTLRRGFDVGEGSRVLIVEDVITTGGSVLEAIEVIEDRGGEIRGIGAIVDRSTDQLSLPVPITSLITLPIDTYVREDCPLCKKGIPISIPGSRP